MAKKQNKLYTLFMNSVKKIITLFITFFCIGIQTFGGGLAMLPVLENELVVKKKWVTREKLFDYFAIGQATPGVIAVNVSTFIGFSQGGVLGGIVATLGVITPSIIIIGFIALFFSNFSDSVLISKALRGMNIAVSALLLHVFIQCMKKSILKKGYAVFGCILVFLSFFCVVFFDISSAIVILAGIGIGLFLHFLSLLYIKKGLDYKETKGAKKKKKDKK